MKEKYCVAINEDRFKSFVEKIIQSFWYEDSNVTLLCEDLATFHTNRSFLGFFSPLIRDLCGGNFDEKQSQIISIPCSFEQVQLFFEFLKNGEFKTTKNETLHAIQSLISTLGIASNPEIIKINHLQDIRKEEKVNDKYEKKTNDTSNSKTEISKDEESQETKCFGFRTGEVEKEQKADDIFVLLKKANSERTEYDSWKCKFCTNSFTKWVGLMVHARKVHEKNPIKWKQNLISNSPNIELPKADESKNSKKF